MRLYARLCRMSLRVIDGRHCHRQIQKHQMEDQKPRGHGHQASKEIHRPPGAARFGNFGNYYEFNSPKARLDMLPDDFAEFVVPPSDDDADGRCHTAEITCLDVGCNTGEMTFALQERLESSTKTANFLAVDLDVELIRRAAENCAVRSAADVEKSPSSGDIVFRRLDITNAEGRAYCGEYLRARGRSRFDIAFCLSVTMWIHLNHGDDGLDRFLRFLASSCDWLLVEPQPWKCYTRAARRMRRAGSDNESWLHFDNLRVRGDVERYIDRMLTSEDCGMVKWKSFGLTHWKRSLVLYKNTKSAPS